ncbi:MAG TPA: amidohydrolase family protein [bacterium]|nr:amidohydrolase family protein [bacterium]
MKTDLVVRDCRVVTPGGVVPCTLAVQEGRVAAVFGPGESPDARRTLDAGGRYVLPGLLDTHVHLGNGEFSFASDCATESRMAVAGGVTTLMPFIIARGSYLEDLPAKRRAVEEHSLVDMLFHVAVVREEQIDEIPEIAGRFGVRSFKAFMAYKGREVSPSGIQGMGDAEIFTVFQRVARLSNALAIVHCENMEIIELCQRPFMSAGRQDTAAWSDSRPVFGELEAIRRMVCFAEAAGIRFLVPHMGIGLGSEFLRRKTWGAARVAVETCPHYLALDKDADRGVAGKVNPPLRGRDQIAALWQRLTDGTIDVVGSDHCPYTRKAKGTDLWTSRPGVPGGTAMILPVLLTEGIHKGRVTWPQLAALTSTNAARLFGLYPRKGALEVGSDADLVVVDDDREVTVDTRTLHTAADFTPYEGYVSRGWAGVTVAGGQVAYEAGEVVLEQRRARVLAPDGASPAGA